jgi:hypothetical protein
VLKGDFLAVLAEAWRCIPIETGKDRRRCFSRIVAKAWSLILNAIVLKYNCTTSLIFLLV